MLSTAFVHIGDRVADIHRYGCHDRGRDSLVTDRVAGGVSSVSIRLACCVVFLALTLMPQILTALARFIENKMRMLPDQS
jgi:hypothetical protein